MAFKIFYAWQSNRPNNVNRGLIRAALDAAATELNADLEVEEAVREVQIDQDTQGVPGSPPIAETILGKIRECNVFVPDLTFIPSADGGRKTPNPNVLIEYGYALHALGDARIIAVFNETYGSSEDLPFDLHHKRWPILYSASDDGDDAEAQRRAACKELASELAAAIRTVIQSYAEEVSGVEPQQQAEDLPEARRIVRGPVTSEPSPTIPAQPAAPSSNVPLTWESGILGNRTDRRPNEAGYQVQIPTGPHFFLRLVPQATIPELTNVQAMQIAGTVLEPLASLRSRGWDTARNRIGPVVFTTLSEDADTAWTATQLFRSGEMWGVDFYHLNPEKLMAGDEGGYIPTGAFEEILIDGLINFLQVAKEHLQLPLPVQIIGGLEGVVDYRLAVDPNYFAGHQRHVGHIFDNTIGCHAEIDRYDVDPYEVLLPLFERVYDAAGEERPDVRAVGKRQR